MLQMWEFILERITWLNAIIGLVVLIATTVAITATFCFSIPAYIDYLEHKEMRRAVEWAETHHKIALTLGSDIDLNEYLLIQKLEETDIENYNPR